MTNPAVYINATSGVVEYYTPQPIIEAARLTMGGIDLDPASSHTANKRVRAKCFLDSNGENTHWHGRIWLNHPFGRRENPIWIGHLFFEFEAGRVTAACCITYACTSEAWFQPLLRWPQCFLSPRTNYILPSGKPKPGVTKGSVVTYFGPHPDRFYEAFHLYGVVKEAVSLVKR